MRESLSPTRLFVVLSVAAVALAALRGPTPAATTPDAPVVEAPTQSVDGPDASVRERTREALCGSGFDVASLGRIQCEFDASGVYQPDYGALVGDPELRIDAWQRAEPEELADSFAPAIETQAQIAMSELLVAIESAVDSGQVQYSRLESDDPDDFLERASSRRSRELYSTTVAIGGWRAVLDLSATGAPAFAETMRDLHHLRHERDAALRAQIARFEQADGAWPAAVIQTMNPIELR